MAIVTESFLRIVPATTQAQLVEFKSLVVEYAESLGFSLCFQGFDQELAELPGKYAPPTGRIFLAECGLSIAGCIALKKLEHGSCEMKRLYVRPGFRGRRVGRALAEKVIEEARALGYDKMYLDTIAEKMPQAVTLYRALGFAPCEAYYFNPEPGALYMVLELRRPRICA